MKNNFVTLKAKCVKGTYFTMLGKSEDGIALGMKESENMEFFKIANKNWKKECTPTVVSFLEDRFNTNNRIKRERQMNYRISSTDSGFLIVEEPKYGDYIYLKSDPSIREKIGLADIKNWDKVKLEWTKWKEGVVLTITMVIDSTNKKYPILFKI